MTNAERKSNAQMKDYFVPCVLGLWIWSFLRHLSFDIRHYPRRKFDHYVFNLAKTRFASSSVSLLPMSSHWPRIWKLFTGLR